MEKMTVKEFIEEIASGLGFNMSEMGVEIGRGGGSSLGRTLRDESLKVTDLRKSLERNGEDLIIIHKGKKIQLT